MSRSGLSRRAVRNEETWPSAWRSVASGWCISSTKIGHTWSPTPPASKSGSHVRAKTSVSPSTCSRCASSSSRSVWASASTGAYPHTRDVPLALRGPARPRRAADAPGRRADRLRRFRRARHAPCRPRCLRLRPGDARGGSRRGDGAALGADGVVGRGRQADRARRGRPLGRLPAPLRAWRGPRGGAGDRLHPPRRGRRRRRGDPPVRRLGRARRRPGRRHDRPGRARPRRRIRPRRQGAESAIAQGALHL